MIGSKTKKRGWQIREKQGKKQEVNDKRERKENSKRDRDGKTESKT